MLPPEDLLTAQLRRVARAGVPADPWWLVQVSRGGALQRSALAQAWDVTVRSGLGGEAAAALRSRLLSGPPAPEWAHLLDLAESHGLSPLTAAECAAAAHSRDRPVRQAAWRYLSGLRDGAAVLPERSRTPADRHEALLLSAAWHRSAPGHPAGEEFRRAVEGLPAVRPAGTVVAQSMMLGRLEEPGAGPSGGMSVLVRALGDALTATGRIARGPDPGHCGRRRPVPGAGEPPGPGALAPADPGARGRGRSGQRARGAGRPGLVDHSPAGT
ncbi:hypothetical protein [Kitasatospora albolonga]|uniref:hypothetical protein n=1 Tax=Kitasatospora albolonga TaxID=68173 RepID=UPI0031EE29F8